MSKQISGAAKAHNGNDINGLLAFAALRELQEAASRVGESLMLYQMY